MIGAYVQGVESLHLRMNAHPFRRPFSMALSVSVRHSVSRKLLIGNSS